MEFLVELIQTIIKMLLLAAVALGGIKAGKLLRDRKETEDKS